MFILDATTKSITAVMSGAAATTNPDFSSHYRDVSQTSFVANVPVNLLPLDGSNDGALNGTNSVILVAAPVSNVRRIVDEIAIHNSDTAAVTITIRYVSAGGTRKQFTITLAVGGTWKLSQSEAAIAAASTTIAGSVELATIAEVTTGTDDTRAVTPDSLYNGVIHRIGGLVSNPQTMYTQRAQIVMFRAPAALTITRIHIHCADTTPTSELAGDLKFADDINIGGFANATIIDVCDTTSGVVTITSSFDDATVPSGKYIYFSMDASPHADIKDFYIEFYYTLD